jgi:FtsZ-interacting cell division protein ZipA
MSKNRNYESQSSKQGTVEQTTEEVAVEENKTEVQQEQDNAVVTTTAAPVVEVKEVEEPKKESLDSFETRIDWVKQNGSTTEKQVINVLENYVKVCTTSISLEAIAI